ncbi:hypothetical protein PHYPO_G00084930 [Pangasianodon hypophthalmus]|uniref:Fatty acyl-CoA reductase n=1 Tax=Pangasianodon hypophthalmus TaxID=310915 RepID=A0A5N5LGU4_PANHP|nr:hypothetical protein PHYPO_G00084930 [Pangasianodon hypophthalmus]
MAELTPPHQEHQRDPAVLITARGVTSSRPANSPEHATILKHCVRCGQGYRCHGHQPGVGGEWWELGVCAAVMACVSEFYAGKCVLITGATGFMGKVLVEKLLRSCPEVKALYLLIRTKQGQSSQQRIHTMLQSKVCKECDNRTCVIMYV